MEKRRARTVLAAACGLHFLHDGLAELLYVLFPVWAREFSLTFARVGLLRTAYSGALAGFQIPAGVLAERLGEPRVLVGGTLVTAAGFLVLGTANSFGLLLVFLIVAGLGSGTQHPLSSSLVARAYEEGPRRMVLGTYNFFGDVGKTAWTALVAVLLGWVGWRWTTRGIGLLGVAIVVALALAFPRVAPSGPPPARAMPSGSWGIRDGRGFLLLAAIHGIDNGSRTAFMTFLPFLLLQKGAPLGLVGLALSLALAGGAAGKFACGALAERLGVIRTVLLTEAATGLGILGMLALPLGATLAVLPALGIALNGTSSVLYGTVPDLVLPERRSRVYGLFYTVGIGSGAVAPPLFGFVSDLVGLHAMLVLLAVVALATLPLAHLLRPSVER